MAIKQRSRVTGKPVVAKTDRQFQKVRVRAVRIGYFDHKRRREGDVFVMPIEVDKNGDVTLPTWVVEDTRGAVKETGAQAALNENLEAARAIKHGGTAPASSPNSDDLGI